MKNKTTGRIGFVEGRPTFFVNGEPISHATYCDVCMRPGAEGEAKLYDRIKDFADSGVKVYVICAWKGDLCWADGSDNSERISLDKQAEIILELVPDAWIITRMNDWLPNEWYTDNPDEVQTPSLVGPIYRKEPSLASKKAQLDLIDFMGNLIRYCESASWSDRLIGYLCYPLGEGSLSLTVGGFFFDQCELMQKTFRDWVSNKYSTEAALRKAWRDDEITFDSIRVPLESEWQQEIARNPKIVREIVAAEDIETRSIKQEIFHWIEGDQLRKIRDYVDLQRELYIDWYKTLFRGYKKLREDREVFFGIDMGKQTMLGWQHNMAFYGIGPGATFVNQISASGAIDIGELLDEPGLDFIVTPADYTDRTVGYGWESEGIGDSMRLRNKVVLVENDSRTFKEGTQQHTLGAFKNTEEMKAGLLRNFAWALSRGQMEYWMTIGADFFHDPIVHEKGIGFIRPLVDKSVYYPHIETEHAIAMIIDDTSPLYENGTTGYQNLAVVWQRVLGLSHCGIPYRIYLFSDLSRDNMPDYKCYLFPNLFMLNDERMQLLKKKVLCKGRTAIFGPSTGITDGNKLSADRAGKLLGVDMDLVKNECFRRVIINRNHDITERLPASMVYGDSHHYGPILVPKKGAVEKAGGIVLGEATTFFEINLPGLFIKDNGDHKIAWSIAVPFPADLLRELARYGGCHVWCEEDDVFYASDTIAAVHSVKNGPRKIKLPSKRTVVDIFNDEVFGENVDEINININAPETRIFYMKP